MEGVQRDRLNLSRFEERAAEIVDQAGALLVDRFRYPIDLEFKNDKQTDPVTATDRAVEGHVKQGLRTAFPEHGILGEEGTGDRLDNEYIWVLDPLDGTANFANHLPFFGVSLGLLRNGVPVVGCLYVPLGPALAPGVLRCSYGNGASINGEPLRLERRAFRPTGPAALPPSFNWAFSLRGELARRPGELRNLGSICFEMAMVAGGGFQYAAFVRPKIWDVAAGILLVREAGGEALTWNGAAWDPFDRFVIPGPRPKRAKPLTLRDWARPILVVGPGGLDYVPGSLRLRPPPPRAIRWLWAQRSLVKRLIQGPRTGDPVAAARRQGVGQTAPSRV